MKVTQSMMTTPWHHIVLEHKGIFLALFKCVVIFKNISNPLVGDENILFVVNL